MDSEAPSETSVSPEYGVLRDASGYRTHHAMAGHDADWWLVPKYHVPANEKMTLTACGRLAAEFTAELVQNITDRQRCQRPGCRERWPR